MYNRSTAFYLLTCNQRERPATPSVDIKNTDMKLQSQIHEFLEGNI